MQNHPLFTLVAINPVDHLALLHLLELLHHLTLIGQLLQHVQNMCIKALGAVEQRKLLGLADKRAQSVAGQRLLASQREWSFSKFLQL